MPVSECENKLSVDTSQATLQPAGMIAVSELSCKRMREAGSYNMVEIEKSIVAANRAIRGWDWRRLKVLGFRGSVRVVTEWWATRRRRVEKADVESLLRCTLHV
jgi:hypothetical protein